MCKLQGIILGGSATHFVGEIILSADYNTCLGEQLSSMQLDNGAPGPKLGQQFKSNPLIANGSNRAEGEEQEEKEEDISEILSQRMLQGWALLETCCPR